MLFPSLWTIGCLVVGLLVVGALVRQADGGSDAMAGIGCALGLMAGLVVMAIWIAGLLCYWAGSAIN